MSLSDQIINDVTNKTVDIDEAKSTINDRSAMETINSSNTSNEDNENRGENQNIENLQGSADEQNTGASVDQVDLNHTSPSMNDASPTIPVANDTTNGEHTALNHTEDTQNSSGEVTSAVDDSSANDQPEDNTEQPVIINSDDVPKNEIKDSGSGPVEDTNATPPSSAEAMLTPTTTAASPAQTAPSETTTSSNKETCSATPTVETYPVEGATAAAATASCSNTSSPANDKAPIQSVYHVKWIKYKGNTVAIITQNENGPCPLLAIMNVLLLKGKIKLPGMIEMVTSGQLMEYLGDCIFENAPKDITEDAQLNYEQNMHDAMAVFHKLQTGLDVNVKFTGVNDFEYTSECIVFDLLNIPLYHGWLTDPESPEVVAAIGNCSYNQLVEKIISQKNSKKEELMTEALICEEFLERTAAQLTYHGLSELVTSVKEDEMCVFFRNNHFSTLYKYKNELFVLVTDQGFLTESNVVWETLANVEGDGHFVDADFRTYRKAEVSTAPIVTSPIPVGSDQQIDQDYLVALSLQQEPPPADMAMSWPTTGQPAPQLTDHELALQLQEEENRRAAAANAPASQRQPVQRTQSAPVGAAASPKKKDKDCIIL